MSELEQRLRQVGADLSEARDQRSALLAHCELLSAECHAAGVMSGAAGFRLAEMRSEVQRLDRRIAHLDGLQAITEDELRERKRRLADARRVLASLPASATSRRELAVIEKLRQRARRVIDELA